MTDTKYIDLESALARLGGNEDLYKKLLAKFETSFSMEEFKDALTEENYTAAGDIAHAAKGVAGNLSLTAFFDQSVIVMNQLREGNYDADEVSKFETLFEETKSAINEMLG